MEEGLVLGSTVTFDCASVVLILIVMKDGLVP